jgi:hypothetical protein
MVTWEQRPFNADHPDRYCNTYMGSGWTTSEFGMGVLLSRLCEFAMVRSAGRPMPDKEGIQGTWGCVDCRPSKRQRKSGPSASARFTVSLRMVYPPFLVQPPARPNDMFVLHGRLHRLEACPFYFGDPAAFAERVLRKTAACWAEAWALRERVEPLPHPRERWPVKLWVAGEPQRVWEVGEDGTALLLPDHPPVDEGILETAPKVLSPTPPTDLQVVEATPDGVTLRFRPSADAERYMIEYSQDGQTFVPGGSLRGDAARPGPDGYCLFIDTPRRDPPERYYRVWSQRGPADNFSPEPTPAVKVPPVAAQSA